MLGLKRHTVKLVPHHQDWKAAFEATKKLLEEKVGHLVLDIQHIGSTAIEGIVAKPILDLALAYEERKVVKDCMPILEEMGYEFRGDGGENGGHVFLLCSSLDVRIQHLHLVPVDGVQWANYLNFRDYMNAYPQKAKAYAAVKQKLAQKYPNSRKNYTFEKTKFIQEIFALIEQEGFKSPDLK